MPRGRAAGQSLIHVLVTAMPWCLHGSMNATPLSPGLHASMDITPPCLPKSLKRSQTIASFPAHCATRSMGASHASKVSRSSKPCKHGTIFSQRCWSSLQLFDTAALGMPIMATRGFPAGGQRLNCSPPWSCPPQGQLQPCSCRSRDDSVAPSAILDMPSPGAIPAHKPPCAPGSVAVPTAEDLMGLVAQGRR